MAKLAPEDGIEKIRNMTVETVSSDGDKAVVKLSTPGEESLEHTMVKVEGKWIPEEMAENWAQEISEARDQIAAISTEDIQQGKAQIVMVLDMVDSNLDQIDATQSQVEFDAQVMQVVSGIMGQMMAMQMGGEDPFATPSEEAVILISRELTTPEQEALYEMLKQPVGGEISATIQAFAGETLVRVSPVPDIEALSQQLPFGKVTNLSVEDRTISVELGEDEELKMPAPVTDPVPATETP